AWKGTQIPPIEILRIDKGLSDIDHWVKAASTSGPNLFADPHSWSFDFLLVSVRYLLTCSPETGPGDMIESPLQEEVRHEEAASSRGADHPDTAGSGMRGEVHLPRKSGHRREHAKIEKTRKKNGSQKIRSGVQRGGSLSPLDSPQRKWMIHIIPPDSPEEPLREVMNHPVSSFKCPIQIEC
ncbi:MAG: hypothetical protein UZ16_OP3001001762, partial [Candidatus Hinthialibacteria bacterium OLB16]